MKVRPAIYFAAALFIAVFAPSTGAFAQEELPAFGPPLEIPLFLSGNFAELRRNHFHTGIDIKTQGVEGQRVIAAEEGRVARIGVSGGGYGKVLYIEHPNGYTTVYAHLKSFALKIDKVVKQEQYAKQSFSVDFSPTEDVLLSRGELIALSGNTGGSAGAHLHFEIRKTQGSRAQNPLLFNFAIVDNLPPRIRGIRFHPLSDTTFINGKHTPFNLVVEGDAGKYRIKVGQKVAIYGAFGVSIHTLDFLNGQSNRCGVYGIELEVEGRQICAQEFNEIDFATSRQINCYKDYESFRKNGWHYHKSFIEPGNELEIYDPIPSDGGTISIAEAGVKKGKYTVTDAYGNKSNLNFELEILANPNGVLPPPEPYEAWLYRAQENTFEYLDEIILRIPAKALYNDLPFQFGTEMPKGDALVPYYQLHRDDVPLDKAISIEFNISKVPPHLQGKLAAARYGTTGNPSYIAGTLSEGKFTVVSKDFGKFTLVADTIKPSLSPKNYRAGMVLTNGSEQAFTIGDNMSGIKRYDAWLNDEWVLMEHEPKQKKIWLTAGELPFKKGSNTLEISVIDQCGNEVRRRFTYTF